MSRRPVGMLDSPMKATLPPAAMLRRWTRAEYDRLIELGAFEPAERLELIDGLLIVREPQGTRHAAGIRRVLDALHQALGREWQIDSQLPLALDPASAPEPDVSVVAREPGAYRDEHPSRPLLIVEVAETSYRIDRQFKTGLYAPGGWRRVRRCRRGVSGTPAYPRTPKERVWVAWVTKPRRQRHTRRQDPPAARR